MKSRLLEILEDCPIITAVKEERGLEQCLTLDNSIVFVLFGDVCSIPGIVRRAREAGKLVFVHIDLIAGLSGKEAAVDYIKQNTAADGILTTKPSIVKRAGELGLYTVLRFFVIDSMAYDQIERQVQAVHPDAVELMPGVLPPKIISKICRISKRPVIAGGLVSDKEDIMAALGAGAVSISTTNESVWLL